MGTVSINLGPDVEVVIQKRYNRYIDEWVRWSRAKKRFWPFRPIFKPFGARIIESHIKEYAFEDAQSFMENPHRLRARAAFVEQRDNVYCDCEGCLRASGKSKPA